MGVHAYLIWWMSYYWVVHVCLIPYLIVYYLSYWIADVHVLLMPYWGVHVRHSGLYKYMSYCTLCDSSADSTLLTLSSLYLTTCACLSCFCWSFCFNFFFTLAFLSFFLDISAVCNRKRETTGQAGMMSRTFLTISSLATTLQDN